MDGTMRKFHLLQTRFYFDFIEEHRDFEMRIDRGRKFSRSGIKFKKKKMTIRDEKKE